MKTKINKVIKVLDTETGKTHKWKISTILKYINENRNPYWIPYTLRDWREGWEHFGVEGMEILK